MHCLQPSEFAEIANRLMRALEASNNRLGVIVVANCTTITPISKECERGGYGTEFFSETENLQMLASLRSSGLFVSPFYDERDFMAWVLADAVNHLPFKDLIVYNSAQNGTGPGRKSLIPSFCNLHGLHVTGSDPYVVSLCRHKFHLNRLFAAEGLPVPESWWYLENGVWVDGRNPAEGEKVIIKLTYESASLGLDQKSVGFWGAESREIVGLLSKKYNQPILVQKFIAGSEVECPLIVTKKGYYSQAFNVVVDGRTKLGDKFLTYEMVKSDAYNFIPAEEPLDTQKLLRNLACRAARLVGLKGIGRIDFRLDEGGKPFIIDVATNPHLIEHGTVHRMVTALNPAIQPFLLLVALKAVEVGYLQDIDQN